MVKSEGCFVPPLVLFTLVTTFNVVDSGVGVYWLVTVQLIFLPSLILSVHPEEYVVVYPERPDADALYRFTDIIIWCLCK